MSRGGHQYSSNDTGNVLSALTYGDIYERLNLMKKRTTVWLPPKLLARLKKLSRKTGAPMAEHFRRAVEAYLKKF